MKARLEGENVVYIEDLGKFDLSQIYEKFKIARFERRLYPAHIGRIKTAVMGNKLVDFVITVWDNTEEMTVIDGQHRLAALWQLFKEDKRKSFPIVIRRIWAENDQEARNVYLSINSGKALGIKDVLKSYDDGQNMFFNTLRHLCTHDGTKKNMPYSTMLMALQYAKRGERVRKENIEKRLSELEKHEVLRMAELLETMYNVSGSNTKAWIFYSNIFRPIALVYWEMYKDINNRKWIKLMDALCTDPTVKANAHVHSIESNELMYNYISKKYNNMK